MTDAPANLFESFGGVPKLAAELGEPMTTVHSWKQAGRIPAKKQPAVLGAARRLGLRVGAEDVIFPLRRPSGGGAAGCAPAPANPADMAGTPADPEADADTSMAASSQGPAPASCGSAANIAPQQTNAPRIDGGRPC